MAVLWRIVLVTAAAFLIWRITSSGLSEYHLQRAVEGDAAEVDKALAWKPRLPDALYRKAQTIALENPAVASKLLQQSYGENPASGLPLLALAGIAQNAGEQDQAAALVEKASRLMPAYAPIQVAAGGYWASRGNLEAALARWSQALEASPRALDDLFPVLLKLVEMPQTIGAFKPFATAPPSWWERFFRQTAERALDLETVRTLYAFRRAAEGAPITREERDQYIRRLKKEGKITEAYLVWVNGLDDVGRAQLGLVNNGGFEVQPSNTGFDWHLDVTDHVVATTGTIAGVEGEKALHLVFKRRDKVYVHVHQPLFLDPGAYRVAGLVRTDGLDSKGGLKWTVRCLLPDPAELGASERFLGSSEWREFSFTAQVPEDCTAQELRLVSAGRREFEHTTTGGIWFDGLSMRKAPTLRAKVSSSATGDVPPRKASNNAVEQDFNAIEVSEGRVFNLKPSLIEILENSDLKR